MTMSPYTEAHVRLDDAIGRARDELAKYSNPNTHMALDIQISTLHLLAEELTAAIGVVRGVRLEAAKRAEVARG